MIIPGRLHRHQDGYSSKNQKITSVFKDMKNYDFVHHLRSCENSGASGETSSMGSQDKTKQNKTKTKQNRTTK